LGVVTKAQRILVTGATGKVGQAFIGRMADEAWSYQRAPDDPRVIWYPG
jgi:uncharacterized protein YbjT (DUF2867 family)